MGAPTDPDETTWQLRSQRHRDWWEMPRSERQNVLGYEAGYDDGHADGYAQGTKDLACAAAASAAAAWRDIVDAINRVPIDDARLGFSLRRELIARARWMDAGYHLKATLGSFDVADPANQDRLREALDLAQAAANRFGWAVGLRTAGEAAA